LSFIRWTTFSTLTTTFNAAGSGALLQGGVDTLNGGEDFDAYYFYDYVIRFDTAIADASSGGVGRMKIDGVAIGNGSDTAFGNLTLYPKVLLHNGPRLAVSGGMGIVLPTASDITARFADGTPLMNISNDAVRLQPFLGGMFTPSERLFVHGFLQCDVETTGNAVRLNATGNGLQRAGTITDGTNLFVDAGVGYWLYKSQGTRGVTGIIPTVEIHQNIALGGSDVVNAGPFTVGNFAGRSSLTNVVAGSTIEFNQRSHLTAAYVGPIGGGSARAFDGGVQLMFNHFFGP